MSLDANLDMNNEQLNVFDQLAEHECEAPSEEQSIKEILKQVYEALCEKGYDPTRQIAGYILSEDPVYITNWKNARGLIGHINRDDLLVELIRSYLKNET